ncbi:MAG TPA: head GIN domain-containing protein [Victivallales bacterium]|nr:head GIN domain-containing protein [Victivallales bacterium]
MKTSNKLFTILLSVIFISIIATMIIPFVTSFKFSGEIKGNGVYAKKTYELPKLNTIKLDTSSNIKIVIGDKNQILLSGDSNILPHVIHQLNGKTLEIRQNKFFSKRLPLKIKITVTNLSKFTLNGAGDIHINGINNKQFSIESNGFGNITAAGKTDHLKIDTTGAGNINCKNLIADDATLSATGVGNVILYAKQSLNATATGIGNVTYYGNPKHVTGSEGTGIGSFRPANRR